MEHLIGKCGFNCSLCGSHKESLKTNEDRQRISDGWHRYFGFQMDPQKLLQCDGCQVPQEENPIRYLNCKIRYFSKADMRVLIQLRSQIFLETAYRTSAIFFTARVSPACSSQKYMPELRSSPLSFSPSQTTR